MTCKLLLARAKCFLHIRWNFHQFNAHWIKVDDKIKLHYLRCYTCNKVFYEDMDISKVLNKEVN